MTDVMETLCNKNRGGNFAMKKWLTLALILVMLVACVPIQPVSQPTATRWVVTRVVTATAAPAPTASAESLVLKMHNAGYDFLKVDAGYQWLCENKLCGCTLLSARRISCGMTYDNPYVSQFEEDMVNMFFIFGVSDDAIWAVHDAQILARDIPDDMVVDVSGSVGVWRWRFTDNPSERIFHTTFWIGR